MSKLKTFQLLFASILSVTLVSHSMAHERTPLEKFKHYEHDAETEVIHIVVKFKEGTGVRMRNGVLALVQKKSGTVKRMPAGVTAGMVSDDSIAVSQLAHNHGHSVKRLINRTEEELDELKEKGEAKTNTKLSNLNLYYKISVNSKSKFANVKDLVKKLNTIKSVEIAYAAPKPSMATIPQKILPPTAGQTAITPAAVTPNYKSQQGYLDGPSRNGVNAQNAWVYPGARGKNVKVFDVEGAWQLTHEDFPSLINNLRTNTTISGWLEHGTAVLGVMAGTDNGIGVTGIASNASYGVSSFNDRTSAVAAITTAAVAAGPGGIILIEMHTTGPITTQCACNNTQCNYVPMEYYQAYYDTIKTATANGVIVLSAAGNGSINMDHPTYKNSFNRSVRDSGSIMVAASLSSRNAPACFTNYGSRIDVHGWGQRVVTTGYGDLLNGGSNQKYTRSFSGTSSATPIVAGSAASIQGARLAKGLKPFNSLEMRKLLVSTGTPQAFNNSVKIGPLPNIRAAIETFNGGGGNVITSSGISSPVSNSTLSGSSVNFKWIVPEQSTNAWLYVGSTQGGREYYSSDQSTNSTGITVSGLPVNGQKLYVRFWFYQSGAWDYMDYIYNAFK